ncbi:phage holin family protein [Brevibacillus laterosporus]|nr:phage holin family protein [Brevibacillus laterosporus]MCR8939402.1 phage holin family protein [Brevibacillus laterosporus]MCZ0842042.1 phage holin family protein [Brevibacillus laterosporus]MCZ0847242.1 phage holin family protein [Brevibacillus laterosporus]MED1910340.1 phage holin family protein [Brevibacillus laterosporus]
MDGLIYSLYCMFYYASGIAAEGKLKSKIGLIGIVRKLFIFGIIAIAYMLDTISLVDRKLKESSQGANNTGIKVGYYHFAHPDLSAQV